MDEVKAKQIKERENKLYTALWEKLGEDGVRLLMEAMCPVSSLDEDLTYQTGYGENFMSEGMTAEQVQLQFHGRRTVVQRSNHVAQKIRSIGFPPVVEKKEKKGKPSFK